MKRNLAEILQEQIVYVDILDLEFDQDTENEREVMADFNTFDEELA